MFTTILHGFCSYHGILISEQVIQLDVGWCYTTKVLFENRVIIREDIYQSADNFTEEEIDSSHSRIIDRMLMAGFKCASEFLNKYAIP